jgi:hypothetical protein
MKKLIPMLLAALLGFGLAGCASPGSQPTITPADVVDFVSGIASNILANTNLIGQVSNVVDNVESPPAGTSAALPKIGAGKTVTGWGPVNHFWQMDDAVIVDGIAYMQAQNVRFFIFEAVGNGAEDVLGTPAKLERAKSRFLLGQAECKKRGIWFAPILFNDNAGDGAYQNGRIKLESRMAQAKAFVDWVAANADKSVCSITVVAEIQTSAGKQLEAYGLAKLGGAGFRLDYNGSARPSSKPAGYSGLRVWHACDVNSWPSKDTLWMNDCGTSIRESIRAMNIGGDLNGLGDPARIAAKKAEAVARGQFVFTIYGFQVATFDKPAIQALSMPPDPAAPPAGDPDTFDLSKVTWLHHDVSSWPVTATLDASISGGQILMPYTKAKVWPATSTTAGSGLNANPWAIVQVGGTWYAGTFEWFRHGQTSKPVGVLDGSNGDHFKVSPLNRWRPKSGERFGLMVSGLARHTERNAKERSNVSWVVWP